MTKRRVLKLLALILCLIVQAARSSPDIEVCQSDDLLEDASVELSFLLIDGAESTLSGEASRLVSGEQENDQPHQSTVSDFFGTFKSLGVSWTHILNSYRRIIRLAGGGHDLDHDIVAPTLDAGMDALRDLSQDLEILPIYEFFGKTREDLLAVFLRWVAAEGKSVSKDKCRGGINHPITINNGGGDEDGSSSSLSPFKVSKAFRRLQLYAMWLEENQHDLVDSETGNVLDLLPSREVFSAFSIQVTRDSCHRIVWWMDLGKTNMDAVRSLTAAELRRFFAWFAHLIMFDEDSQRNGIVFVNNLAHIRFWDFMTMLPLEVGIKTDEFMICVIPLRTKLVAFLNRPSWAEFAYRLLSVFLNKDMKSRVFVIRDKIQEESLAEILGGTELLAPKGFGKIEGAMPVTDVLEKSFLEQVQERSYSP